MKAPLHPATGLIFTVNDFVPLLPYLRDAAGRAGADALAADAIAARCASAAADAAHAKGCFTAEWAWVSAFYELAEQKSRQAAQAAEAAAMKARRAAAHLNKIIRAVEELSCS